MRAKGQWAVQKGTWVRYVAGRVSGTGRVMKVIQPDRVGSVGVFIVEDENTGEQFTVYGTDMDYTPKRVRRIKGNLPKKVR